jgi:hypothetical protein
VGILFLTVAPALGAGCASTNGPVALRQPASPPAPTLSDVQIPPGAACVVHLTNGRVVRGRLAGITADRVELDLENGPGGPQRRVIAGDDVDVLARMVTMSRGKRGKIGAAIGALVSLPFGISMFGDMVMPAAIVGALIGYNSGEPRAEVVFQRRPVPQ